MQKTHRQPHHDRRTTLTGAGALSTSRNPTGARASTLAHQQAEQQATAFAGLPAGTNKFTVLHLLKEVGPALGWTAQLLRHVELLIGFTRDQDWEPGANPVVWLSVRETAYKLNISESQVRRNESALMRLDAIAFKDSGNHRRFGRRNTNGNIIEGYGIDPSPAADLIPQLTILAESLARDRAEWHRVRHALSAARRRVQAVVTFALLEQRITDEAGEVIEDRIALHGARPPAASSHEDLQQRLEALEEIEAELAAVIDDVGPQPSPAQAAGRTPPPSDPEGGGQPKPRHNPRHHDPRRTDLGGSPRPEQAQELTKISPHMDGATPCSAGPGKHERLLPLHYKIKDLRFKKLQGATGGRKGSESTGARVLPAEGGPGAREGTDSQTPAGLLVAIDTLTELMPPAMRAWLPVNRRIDWDDLGAAAAAHASELGISPHAWGEACLMLGRQTAAIALIVIAVKHQRQLVAQPGGYLRAMTARSTTGELHLARSVYGLLNAPAAAATHAAGAG